MHHLCRFHFVSHKEMRNPLSFPSKSKEIDRGRTFHSQIHRENSILYVSLALPVKKKVSNLFGDSIVRESKLNESRQVDQRSIPQWIYQNHLMSYPHQRLGLHRSHWLLQPFHRVPSTFSLHIELHCHFQRQRTLHRLEISSTCLQSRAWPCRLLQSRLLRDVDGCLRTAWTSLSKRLFVGGDMRRIVHS